MKTSNSLLPANEATPLESNRKFDATIPDSTKDEIYLLDHDETADRSYELVSETASAAAATTKRRRKCSCRLVPGPVWVHNIVVAEACERFCYYGLRAILTLFMKNELNYSKDDAVGIYEYFVGSVYATCIFGGWMSDSFLGKFNTILIFSCVYCLGTGFLVLSAILTERWAMFIGLVLIAIGTGGIKPCVAAFGAEQYKKQSAAEITTYFLAFYASINCGSLFSYIVTPLLREYVSFAAAFGVSTALLLVSVVIFAIPKKHYVMNPPTGSVLSTFTKLVRAAISKNGGCFATLSGRYKFRRALLKQQSSHEPLSTDPYPSVVTTDPEMPSESRDDFNGLNTMEQSSTQSIQTSNQTHWLDSARTEYSEYSVESVKAVWNLTPILSTLPFFWMLYDQQGSSWTVQAESMDRSLGSITIQPDMLGVLNPLLVMAFIYICGRFLFPAMARLPCKIFYPTALKKMAIGMCIATVSFLIAAFVQLAIYNDLDGHMETSEGKTAVSNVTFLWMLPQYITITFAEILVSTTGLEWMYTQAPYTMRGLIIALWYLSTGIGDFIAGALYTALNGIASYKLFFMFSSLMLASAFVFAIVAIRYHPSDVIQNTKGNNSSSDNDSASQSSDPDYGSIKQPSMDKSTSQSSPVQDSVYNTPAIQSRIMEHRDPNSNRRRSSLPTQRSHHSQQYSATQHSTSKLRTGSTASLKDVPL